jgi:nicotinamide-nucleotide amidase
MRVEIICTGDEILTGKTVNTNFSHISRKLEEAGLQVHWGTTVGDDPETLLEAFRQAGKRADAVIVNGGLGPTVDDLSQEIAAQAAGVALVLNENWLGRIEALFSRYGLTMQPNNRKQALLPESAELIDNPIGTACGFELDIGGAHFYFTPGVPKELHLMLNEQILPRLMARSGIVTSVRVKRFHVFGVGESHADALLEGIDGLIPGQSVKLGFQTHYPQLEAKLTLRSAESAELPGLLAPVEAEVRRRLANFIVAEDDDTLEGNILMALQRRQASLAVAETLTSGLISARLAPLPGAASVFRRGLTAPSNSHLEEIVGLAGGTLSAAPLTEEALMAVARALLRQTGATHALVALADNAGVALADNAAEGDLQVLSAPLWFAIATAERIAVRQSRLRLVSGDWLRAGAVEMGLDSLRRFLLDIPVSEKTDFENT